MSKLSTAAWVAHELGLAASFGGVLFGKVALNPNLDAVESKPDRGKLLNKAWNRYNAVNIVSTGTAIATWLVGRGGIKGRAIDEDARNLVLAKDALLATAAVTGARQRDKRAPANPPGSGGGDADRLGSYTCS